MHWKVYLTGAIALAAAAPAPAGHVVHEERNTLGSRWVKGQRVRSGSILQVRIGLKQNEANMEAAHEHLMAVSHPESPQYGKHWTMEQVIEAFKPSDETVDVVRQWLIDNGIPRKSITHSDNKGWLAFNTPAKLLEELLRTDYHEFEDVKTGGVLPACERYHVPHEVQAHIDYITPGVKLMAPIGGEIGDESMAMRKRQSKHSAKRPILVSNMQVPGELVADKNDVSNCDKEITPACIAALYRIPPAPKHVDPSNSVGVFESVLQFWAQADLDLYFTNFTQIPPGTHPINNEIDGGVAQTADAKHDTGEAQLDLTMVYPIVYPQTVTVWNVDDLVYQGWPNDTYTWGFNTLLDAIDGSYCTFSAYGETGNAKDIDPEYPNPRPGGYKQPLQCGVFKPTNVFTFSYSGQESDLPIAYQKRQCLEYMKLGLQGVTFVFSSGDYGIGAPPGPNARGQVHGPKGCLGPKDDIFNPGWPMTCPYGTVVGGTKVYPGRTVHDPEMAVNVAYASGGGFSNVFAAPDYQKAALQTYFEDHDPKLPFYSALAQDAPNPALPDPVALAGNTGGVYNRKGRGTPDVAAVSDKIISYSQEKWSKVAGTSASAPIFAAIINRINEERLAAGKTPVGFINPVLYAHPEVLNDIIGGNNKACQNQGFDAVKGWDPVTGLGTPNYPKMRDLFMSLP